MILNITCIQIPWFKSDLKSPQTKSSIVRIFISFKLNKFVEFVDIEEKLLIVTSLLNCS